MKLKFRGYIVKQFHQYSQEQCRWHFRWRNDKPGVCLTGVRSFLRDSLPPLSTLLELSDSLVMLGGVWEFWARAVLDVDSGPLLWVGTAGGDDCDGGGSVEWVPKRVELRVRPVVTVCSALPLICGSVCLKEAWREWLAGGAAASVRGGTREETRLFLSGLMGKETEESVS